MKSLIESLTHAEVAEYKKLDAVIKAGAQTFMEVGQALVVMSEGKLYRAEFKTFEEYAASRGIKRRQAYNLMTAVQLSLELKTMQRDAHDTTPVNAGVIEKTSARALVELSRAPKSKRAQIFKKAVERSNGAPTQKAVAEVIAEVTHKPKPKPVAAPVPPQQPDIPDNIEQAPPKVAEKVVPMTVARFDAALRELEAQIPKDISQLNKEKFALPAMDLAKRLANPPRSYTSAYV